MKEILKKYLNQEITVDDDEAKLIDVSDNYFSVFFDGTIKIGNNVFPSAGGAEKRYYPYASIIKIVETKLSLNVRTINKRNIDESIIGTLKEMY